MTKELLENGIAKRIVLCRLIVELVVTHQAPWLKSRGECDLLQKHGREGLLNRDSVSVLKSKASYGNFAVFVAVSGPGDVAIVAHL
jgi:hypothetical protein